MIENRVLTGRRFFYFTQSTRLGRILAIDYGGKRTGLAVTDPLQIIASALDAIDSKDVLRYLKHYLSIERVDCIVVGKPKNLDGTPTHATALVESFIATLQKNFPNIPVKRWDERFTSKMAVQALVAGDFKKKDRRKKENLDKISATLILQEYLQSIQK